MKLNCLPLVLLLFVCSVAQGQITKGNWLAGGNAYYSSTRYNFPDETWTRTTDLDLLPNLGFFVADHFAVGLKLGYKRYATTTNHNLVAKDHTYKLGPFLRYYFFPNDKQINLLVEGAYQYSVTKTNAITVEVNDFSFAGGPVFYFNSAVGLELQLRYSTTRYPNHDPLVNNIRLGLGLQVHLKND